MPSTTYPFDDPTERHRYEKELMPERNLRQRWLKMVRREEVEPVWSDPVHGYARFRAHMGVPERDNLHLVRRDKDKPHGPGNSAWRSPGPLDRPHWTYYLPPRETHLDAPTPTQRAVLRDADGRILTMSEAAHRLGIQTSLLRTWLGKRRKRDGVDFLDLPLEAFMQRAGSRPFKPDPWRKNPTP